METRPVARRISALILAVTVSVIGMALPAAGQQDVAAPGHRALTINGRPLSQLLPATAITRATIPHTGSLRQGAGLIRGVALDGNGQPIADETVQLRQVSGPGGAGFTEVIDRTTTDPSGGFSFAALNQGRYIVDLRIEGQVVTKGPISLAEAGITFIQVGGVADRQSTTEERNGRGALFWAAVGAGVGGALGLVAIANSDDCEFAENLCPVVPMMGTIMGAFGGLMVGAGR